ncbi:hypothetical protein [Desulfocicer vacuolatum]|nr:hypothetical protein [Desulfocicer vacuolatum]
MIKMIKMIIPEPGTEVIAKKPIIKCRVAQAVDRDTLVVILDNMDVTAIVIFTEKGFHVKPVAILPSGAHTLMISGVSTAGERFEVSFDFSSRHSTLFDEAYSNNEVTALYDRVMAKSDNLEGEPDGKVEANLTTDNILQTSKWRFLLNSNIRYFDQSTSAFPPPSKGVEIINYLLTAKYRGNELDFTAATGDLQLNESENTVAYLSRRGGQLLLKHKNFNLNSFVVKSDQIFGFDGDLGLEGDLDDHIIGVSGAVNLFSDKLQLKTVYATGSEPGDDFGSWSTSGDKKGNVIGFIMGSHLLDDRVILDAELDFSRYDADTLDEFGSESDKAYRIGGEANIGNYSLRAIYKYTGPEYQVVGNPSIQKDLQGISIQGGTTRENHAVTFSFSQYHDNVKSNPLYSRIKTMAFGGDYNFTGFQAFPMGISFERTSLTSSREPEFTDPIRTYTDTLTGHIAYIRDRLSLGFQAGYGFQEDRISDFNDTTNINLSLSPSYSWDRLSIYPSFSFNRSRAHFTHVNTDTYTTNLSFNGNLIPEKMACEFSGTYNKTTADDNSTDMDTINASTRITYFFTNKFWIMTNPAVALMAQYNQSRDRLFDQEEEEFRILLSFTNNISFSF